MDGTWGYYAKWNKSEKEIHDFIYMWNLKNKSEQTQSNSRLHRTSGFHREKGRR